jgi:hypothetical protein
MNKTRVKRWRGRPRKDYGSEVDKEYFNLKIISVVESPRGKDGVMVLAEFARC